MTARSVSADTDTQTEAPPPAGRVLVVIPAYNEAERIGAVVRAAAGFAPVLVVDDGSRDATARSAADAGAEVLCQFPNQGKGTALRAGFRRALETGYAAVITLDGDGQHDPREIPAFLAAWADRSSDLIIGQRQFSQMPWPRRLANTFGRWLFSWALGQFVPDNQSGYRLLSRRLMAQLLTHTEPGFEFEVEMLATCLKSRYDLAWVPIRTIYSGEASHVQPVQHIVNFFRIVWATRQRMRARAAG